MAGITKAFKNLTSPSGPTEHAETHPSNGAAEYAKEAVSDATSAPRRSATTGSHKLPPGTGPGTSGKPTSESAMEYDRERAREQGTIAGYGTDSAAAHGGGLADTHRDSLRPTGERLSGTEPRAGTERSVGLAPGVRTVDRGTTVVSSVPGQAAPVTSGRGVGTTVDRDRLVSRGSQRSSLSSHSVLDEMHSRGHAKYNTRDAMPSGATQEDTNQLNPVTHERIRHLETEEVSRVMEVDRHIHHVQHHIQPVIASETLVEQIKDLMHPPTNIREVHANKVEDNTLFDGQVRQHHDTLTHLERERTIIDKGVSVTERVHHHVHHVIQPIIEKETIDRQRVRMTIPIHEVTHEAPIVHQSQTHSAVPIEHFLQRGGILQNAIQVEDIGSRVLHTGQCTREIDGIADDLSRDLNLTDTYGRDRDQRERELGTTTGHTHSRLPREREEYGTGAQGVDLSTKHKSTRAPEPVTDAPITMPMASN